jgi:light-regulated signal transduction histidine kinase (bacteriophytochrome)
MGELIDDLLNFSRIGRREMKRSSIPMSDLALNVFEELKGECQERSIEFLGNDLPSAVGDHQMIRQVLINLFSNAIKFTKHQQPAKIEMGATEEGDENVYYIKDNGVGFDMNYSNKLFGVFQRLHSVEEFEGTGVGLAIVQRVIQRHGGRVWAEADLNQGATFYFTLPRGAA